MAVLGLIFWTLESASGRLALNALYGLGCLTVLIATFLINLFDLLGLHHLLNADEVDFVRLATIMLVLRIKNVRREVGMIRVPGLWLMVVLSALTFQACGGGSIAPPSPQPGPTPVLQAISPNSSEQSGPALTLSLVGSNFLPNSRARWNGTDLPTTFVNRSLLTAQVSASALASAGPEQIPQ